MSDEILKELRDIRAMLTALLAGGRVASAAELDDKYGDFTVPFDPKTWRGKSYAKQPASQCPPDFLDHMAATFDSLGRKAEAEGAEYKGKPEAPRKYRDAALARGWALRKRLGGWTPEAKKPTPPAAFGAVTSFGGGGSFGGSIPDEALSDFEIDDAASAAADSEIPFIVDMTGRRFDRP